MFVGCERWARLPVPAAGIEPAAPCSSGRCSDQLSYTGMSRWRARLLPSRTIKAGSAGASPSRRNVRDAGRSRTCFGSLCRRPPGRPAPASKRASGGNRTHTLRLTRALLSLLSFAGLSTGGRNRTFNALIKSQVLCLLSYTSVSPQYPSLELNQDLHL